MGMGVMQNGKPRRGQIFRIQVILIVIWCATVSCTPNEEDPITCVATPTTDAALFENNSDWVEVTRAELLTDCLDIQFSYNGCTEEAEYTLVFSEEIGDTYPVSKFARLHLLQDGDCNNTYVGTLQVNLSSIRVPDTDSIEIELEGWATPILYVYTFD
jgi:hypothetical protein